MTKIKEGLNVIVIGNDNQVRKGIVKKAYDFMKTAIVEFEDGFLEKVPVAKIGVDPFPTTNNNAPVEEPKEPDKSSEFELREKLEITITKDQLFKASSEITVEMMDDNPLVIPIISKFIVLLGLKLFTNLDELKENE
jgi:hypothetical protein